MTRADILLHQEILEILENGYKDINPRPKYPDGTPAHTISINHALKVYSRLVDHRYMLLQIAPIHQS